MIRAILAALSLIALASCKPPATDDMTERGQAAINVAGAPSTPADSPDTQGALWADGVKPNRILYGKLGEAPMLALTCDASKNTPQFRITRFVAADAEAKAFMALIGNGQVTRLPVTAEWNGRVWLWVGRYAPGNPDLDVFSGPRQVEVTIPGAGSLILNPSQRPGQWVERCRQLTPQIAAPE